MYELFDLSNAIFLKEFGWLTISKVDPDSNCRLYYFGCNGVLFNHTYLSCDLY